MANLVRLAKSGGDWSDNELAAYNITIQEQDEALFFGGPLPEPVGPPGFIEHKDRVQGLDAPSLSLIKHLDLTMPIMEGEESAVVDFAVELLRVMGYERDETTVRTRKSIWLHMCGHIVLARTDVCLMDDSSEILFLLQEDKSHINPLRSGGAVDSRSDCNVSGEQRKKGECSFLGTAEDACDSWDNYGWHLPYVLQNQSYCRFGSSCQIRPVS
jgi:hypothetical protein